MSPSPLPGGAAGAGALAAHKKLSVLERKFLEALCEFPEDAGATMGDLQPRLEGGGIALDQIARVVNALLRKGHIEVVARPGGGAGAAVYKLVKLEEKEKVEELEKEEKLVYSFIKQVGAEGIWVRTLANRTSLHQNILNKALKKLEQRQLIKTVKSVKHGNKKLYMLYELQPSNEVTGGVWFTDQELDVDFVETVARSCLRLIAQHSFPADPLAVYPPNYNGYPTLTKVVKYLKASKIANVELAPADVELVLDMLVYDNKIERVPVPAEPLLMHEEVDDDDMGGHAADIMDSATDNWMYRARRDRPIAGAGAAANAGWAHMPCGVCPVRKECSEHAPINPRTCDYLGQWLEF